MLIGAGQWHYLAFSLVKKLETQNGVLNIAERIQAGTWREEECASTGNLADILDCIQYYRSEGNYQTAIVRRALTLVENQLKQQKTAQLRQFQRDLQTYLTLNERDARAKWIRDSIEKVEKDSLQKVKIIEEDLQSVEVHRSELKNHPGDAVTLTGLARAYGNLAFHYLFVRQAALAIDAALKGLECDNKQTWIYTNLALGYLYNGEWAKAENIYKQWMEVDWKTSGFGNSGYKTFRDAFLGDLNDPDLQAIPHSDLAKARALLEGKKQ